jgi:hypothetical protein
MTQRSLQPLRDHPRWQSKTDLAGHQHIRDGNLVVQVNELPDGEQGWAVGLVGDE